MNLFESMLDWLGSPKRRKLGHKPDRTDTRDKHIDELLLRVGAPVAVPTSGSVYDSRIAVKDQLDTNSCEGQALANAVRAAYLALGQDCPDLSALFAYYGARVEDGGPITDDGARIRDGIKALRQVGECEEAVWPFREMAVNRPPSWRAFQSAIKRRGLRGYYAIPSGDVDRVKRTLAARIPIIAGWLIDETFMDGTIKGTQGPCKGKLIGGHAMMIESFERDLFKNLNSWGKGYRLGGRYQASSDFIATANSLWGVDVRP